MKRSAIPTLVLTTALMLSACTAQIVPETTPTMDIVQQVTMIAGTFISEVETQAAIPTATLPATDTPTSTPYFTPTAPPLPTLDVTLTPVGTANPYTNDPCVDKVLPDVLTGQKIKIHIFSPVDKAINVSVYLQNGNTQSVCGYRSYVLPAGDTLVINDLVVGCYSIWAWDPDPKTYFMVTNGTTCMNTSQTWKFDIFPNGSIKLHK